MALTRRRFLAIGGATGAAAAFGGGVATARATDDGDSRHRLSLGVVPFYGAHQSGIATEQQDRLMFAAFDLTATDRAAVVAMLRAWTGAAARLTAGDLVGLAGADALPPVDTGEADGLDPARLTITFGFGPGLFERTGAERPAALADLPRFPGDNLDPGRSGGDLCVQACSNDPQVAYHAVRNLARLARGTAVLRWTQQGFGRTSATTPRQVTPRNLLGFKDGTNNLRAGTRDFDENVWVGAADDPAWMRGGTYLVVRRIRMHIEVWDRSSLADQEATIGRAKSTGAPLGARDELAPVHVDALPADAHVRLANQAAHNVSFLRRGYSFTDGQTIDTGQLDAGLFFLAFQRDPRHQFVPMQDRLSRQDALNEYIQHVGSALFAIPPGVEPGGFVGQTLLES